MDGYHFENMELKKLGPLARKGTPETFDTSAFAAILKNTKWILCQASKL